VYPRSAEQFFGSISSTTRVFPEGLRRNRTFVLLKISFVFAIPPLYPLCGGTLLSHHAQPLPPPPSPPPLARLLLMLLAVAM
jgi:hypothetical protein